MMNAFLQRALGGLARHGLTIASGYLVAKGYITEDMATEFTGYGMGVGGVLWSIYEKWTA